MALFSIAAMYIRQRSSICIQLITCLPLPKIPAIPNFMGFKNSAIAPPSLLSTIPVLNLQTLMFSASAVSMLCSQSLQVSPKKLSAGFSSSVKKWPAVLSSPYHPMADALTMHFTWCVLFFKVFISKALLWVRLSIISFL